MIKVIYRFGVLYFTWQLFCLVDAKATWEEEVTTESLTTTTDPGYVEESLVIVIFASLFAFCISLIAVTVGTFFFVEDSLLRKLQNEGDIAEGKVFESTEEHRARDFVANVEYQYIKAGGYTTLIRKQMKSILPSDLYEHETPQQCEQQQVRVELQEFSKDFSFDGSAATFQEYKHKYIKVLVLPDTPHSGIPQNTVRRSLSSRHPTIIIVLVLELLAMLCIHMGISTFSTTGNNNEPKWRLPTWEITLVVTATLSILQALILHLICGEWIYGSIHEEYLEGGDMLIKMDDITEKTHPSSFDEESPPGPMRRQSVSDLTEIV